VSLHFSQGGRPSRGKARAAVERLGSGRKHGRDLFAC
jgi:hypothetical protein